MGREGDVPNKTYDGLKFRTTRRQPTSCFVSWRGTAALALRMKRWPALFTASGLPLVGDPSGGKTEFVGLVRAGVFVS